jgi:hypothetical protein
MTVPLGDLLEHVLAGEPDLGDEVDAVFRRADALRRRRTRLLLAGGLAAVLGIALAGYVLTTTLMPASRAQPQVMVTSSAVPMPSAVVDPVLAVVAPVIDGKGLRVFPREPARGDGWRQYSVLDRNGDGRGTIEIAVYAAPGKLCFPVLADENACARTELTGTDMEFLRYDDAQDQDWQVNETIARRLADGRTVAVMSSGERGVGKSTGGKPGLTGAEVERIATDVRTAAAFGPHEQCNGTAGEACPVFRVPVPVD